MNPHAMEHAKRGAERISGVSNVTYDLISVLSNELEGIAAIEEYKQDAEAAGDREVVAFFESWQQTARAQVEQLRGLLGRRLGGGV